MNFSWNLILIDNIGRVVSSTIAFFIATYFIEKMRKK